MTFHDIFDKQSYDRLATPQGFVLVKEFRKNLYVEKDRGENMGETKEFLKNHGFMVASIVIFFVVILALSYAYLFAQPAFLKQERQNEKSSFQYSEAKDTELLKYVSSYNDLETKKQEYIAQNTSASVIESIETQQVALADQIRNGAELAPDQSRLPESVKRFLRDHPR